MTDDEFRQYWRPAREKYFFPDERDLHAAHKNASSRLAEIIGVEYPVAGYWAKIELTDELKRRLQALVGPHGDTVVKVLKVRRDT